jgi:DNA processing protein
MGALPVLADALALARQADVAVYRDGLAKRGIACVTISEPGYPARLQELHDPPLAVFTSGPRLDAFDWPSRAAGIVGSRRPSEAGLRLAGRLGSAVAGGGGLVVSGLALGIDAAAHIGALDARGVTVAVLGCGVDIAYPRTNRRTFDRIREVGLLVSEYPPGTRPAPWRFPARNRMIAALSDAVVVVEARASSGALITSDHALDLGRDVLAVPGSPGIAGAAGANGLLKAGAGLIEGPDDLCAWLGLDPPEPPPAAVPDGEPARVLSALADEPAAPDELAVRLGMPASAIASALTRLELAGRVVRDESGRMRPG